MHFTPREYQTIIENFAFDHPRSSIWAPMGFGKTTASLSLINSLFLFGESKHVLILAPKRVAMTTWPGEVHKWAESFGHIEVAAAVGTEAQRLDVLRRMPRVVAINYDVLPWLIEVLGDKWYFDTVICDEATRLKGLRIMLTSAGNVKGQGSSRAKALASVAHKKVRRWVNLTGSPAPNGIIDLWGQQWFVDGGKRLGASFTSYTDRWFRSVPGSSEYETKLEPLRYAQQEIEDLMRDCTLALKVKDWFDVKDVVENHVLIDLPPGARRAYDKMEKEFFTEVEGNLVTAPTSSAKGQKCLQIGNGAVWVDREMQHWEVVHDLKLQALQSIVEESAGAPLLIRYTSVPDKERILKAFPRFRFLDQNPATVEAFNRGKIPGLVTHAMSAGHGLSLQDNCWTLVDFSTDYSLEHDEQIIERVGPVRQLQSGYDRVVVRHRILARDTLEHNVCLPVVKRKASVQDALKDAMRARR